MSSAIINFFSATNQLMCTFQIINTQWMFLLRKAYSNSCSWTKLTSYHYTSQQADTHTATANIVVCAYTNHSRHKKNLIHTGKVCLLFQFCTDVREKERAYEGDRGRFITSFASAPKGNTTKLPVTYLILSVLNMVLCVNEECKGQRITAASQYIFITTLPCDPGICMYT